MNWLVQESQALHQSSATSNIITQDKMMMICAPKLTENY